MIGYRVKDLGFSEIGVKVQRGKGVKAWFVSFLRKQESQEPRNTRDFRFYGNDRQPYCKQKLRHSELVSESYQVGLMVYNHFISPNKTLKRVQGDGNLMLLNSCTVSNKKQQSYERKQLSFLRTQESKNLGFRVTNLIKAMFLLIAFSSISNAGVLDYFKVQDATKAFESKEYDKAITNYETLAKEGNQEAIYNLGVSYYKAGKYEDAVEEFKKIVKKSLKFNALYNLGNSYTNLVLYDKAIKAFQEALKIKDDKDAKYNLELLKKLKKREEEKKKKREQQKKNRQNSKDKKEQQNKKNKQNKDKNSQNKKEQNSKNQKQNSKSENKKQDSKNQQKNQQNKMQKEQENKAQNKQNSKEQQKQNQSQKQQQKDKNSENNKTKEKQKNQAQKQQNEEHNKTKQKSQKEQSQMKKNRENSKNKEQKQNAQTQQQKAQKQKAKALKQMQQKGKVKQVPISDMEERKWRKSLERKGINTLMLELPSKGVKDDSKTPW